MFRQTFFTIESERDVYWRGLDALLNTSLAREGYEAFYGPDKQCHLRHLGTGTVAGAAASPHRPFTASERRRRELLTRYLECA
jgi:hypothetical protein